MRRLVVVAGVLAAAWAIAAGVVLGLAIRDATTGRNAADEARGRLDADDVLEGRALPPLRRSARRFDRAADRLSSPVLAPLRVLPWAGRQLRGAGATARAGARTATIATAAIADARALLRAPPPTGPERVVLLRRLARVAATAERRLSGVDADAPDDLVGPLARAAAQLEREVADARRSLRKVAAGARAAGDLLAGPRRYLVFAANNAEMRAGSGMFLSVGELHTSGGRIELGAMRSVTEVDVPEGVPVGGALEELWGWSGPGRDWRNLMMSPRFDAAAPVAVRMWAAAGNGAVDGVLALDPVALRALLRATGPVEVEGRRIHEGNVLDELFHDQYLRFPTGEDRPERREQLGGLARATVAALDTRSWSVADLVEDLGDAIRGRHLLAWSSTPDEQRAWRLAGADGGLTPSSVMVALLNNGGNKLDPYVSVDAHLSFHTAAASVAATLEVVLTSRPPREAPRYILGPHPGTDLAPGEYRAVLAVSLPAAARDVDAGGAALVARGVDGPTRVVAVPVEVGPGGTARARITFSLPRRRQVLRVEPSAREPAVRWRAGELRWRDDHAASLRVAPT